MRKNIWVFLILAGVMVSIVSNHIKAQGAYITPGPSCRNPAKSICSDYSGSNPADLPSYEKMCPLFGGEWSLYGCPAPGPCRNDQQGIQVCDMK